MHLKSVMQNFYGDDLLKFLSDEEYAPDLVDRMQKNCAGKEKELKMPT